MTLRSLSKSLIVSAIVFGAVPMDASACFWGHGGWGPLGSEPLLPADVLPAPADLL